MKAQSASKTLRDSPHILTLCHHQICRETVSQYLAFLSSLHMGGKVVSNFTHEQGLLNIHCCSLCHACLHHELELSAGGLLSDPPASGEGLLSDPPEPPVSGEGLLESGEGEGESPLLSGEPDGPLLPPGVSAGASLLSPEVPTVIKSMGIDMIPSSGGADAAAAAVALAPVWQRKQLLTNLLKGVAVVTKPIC